MKIVTKNKKNLFELILLSYLRPKSKKKLHQKIKDIYLPVIMKCLALSCLLLTILTWMGINGGLNEEYRRFKKDPYTTAIFVTSNRYLINKGQVDKIKIIRYDAIKKEFNTEGKGEGVYDDETFSFSSLDLIFYAKDGETRTSFRGRTVGKSDKKMLEAISAHPIIYKKAKDYNLVKNWEDSENGIIVSKRLLESLGYKVGEPLKLDRLIDKKFHEKDYSFKVPVEILVISETMPFGDFIVSEEFNYNRLQDTFAPFDTVERFYVLTPPEKEKELKSFVNGLFKYCKEIIEINRNAGDNRIQYEIVFKGIPSYKENDYKALCDESSKFFIHNQFKGSPFECIIDFYDWKPLPEEMKEKDPEFLTLYLREKYIDRLEELDSFLNGLGVEMDDTVLNLFKNYHRDMRRFRNISTVFYFVLISLGIFISIAVYIKSVQATMHRLGVFSAFGISAFFLSGVLAVESVVVFLASTLIARVFYTLPLFMMSKEIAMKLSVLNIFIIVLGGSLLSFIVVFLTVRSILKKSPYSLMEYRS